ncbi:MAG: 2-oxoglutarate and iron-dependent oxygenase domain-containing protein [Minwuia sp.]|nr:2-oxoglutarate and iron-dependent oxygenase domain-containing protein [Minwuia sp.]
MTDIPVIDLGPLAAEDGGGVPARIAQAMQRSGFFYITNHGVDVQVIAHAADMALAFFRLPPDEKRKVAVTKHHRGFNALGDARMYKAKRPDHKEFFQIGLDLPLDDVDVAAGQPLRGPNIWPETPPGFRDAFETYYAAMADCGQRLLQGVALSLGVDRHFFAPFYAKPLQRSQAVYYPQQPATLGDDQFGVAPHTDFGLITLLWQDDNGGLEVCLPDGQWIAAPPIPGSLVINAGDLMARWTGGRYRSTPHRATNRHAAERLSIATFHDPDFMAPIDPADLVGDVVDAADVTTAGAHILGRINDSFGYRSQKVAGA